MKKLLTLLVIAIALFTACKEKEGKETICPTIDSEFVPLVVKDSLAAHYPGATVEAWYKVDAVGFCAKFLQTPNTIFAHFGLDGAFQDEEIVDANGKDVDTDNVQEENQNNDNTCECR